MENQKNRHTMLSWHFSSGPALLAWPEDKNGPCGPAGRRGSWRLAGGREAARFSVEHRWRGVGAPGNNSAKGRVRVGWVTTRWRNELGKATVVGGDGEGSLQH
jgi:hypothetical protein